MCCIGAYFINRPIVFGFNKHSISFLTDNRNSKVVIALGYIISLLSLVCAVWICVINFQEIQNRFNGRYTFYSQRASLTDGQAVLYFGAWTLLFILLCILSIRNLMKERFRLAIIYGTILLGMIIASFYIDTLFYYDLI